MTQEREQLLDQNYAAAKMFQHQGIWLPAGEKHFPDWMTKNGELIDGKGTYQIRKLRAALEHCKQLRTAVDVGAHVGLWSMQLVKRFRYVHAFEPVREFRECFGNNLQLPYDQRPDTDYSKPIPDVLLYRVQCTLYPMALGAARGKVSMKIPTLDGGLDTGGTHVGGDGDIEMRTLDEFDFGDVDLLKIDCEGYEHHVIAGARETLIRCRPCVIVEQKPHKLGPNFGIKGTPAVDLLRELGAEVRLEISGDFILTWS
jgi:hypothetical protein